MSDQLLKTVRITDNIKLELYQQGKRRKYALFYDNEKTRSEKFNVSMSDNDVIKESLLEYSRKLGKTYTIIQDPYKDPFLQRVYGSDKYPYYLNNGCSIVIKWSESYKNIIFNLPNGFTENGGKGYLVWTDTGLQYNDKTGIKIIDFSLTIDDSYIINSIISDFKLKVSKLHGVSEYDLKLCEPDTESCSIIEYKSPLQQPNITPQQAITNETPPGPTQSVPKVKISIDGLPSDFKVKAKEDLPIFTIWAGDIPKPREVIDKFDELSELDPEYLESGYAGFEETGVDLKTWKVQGDVANSQEDCSRPSGILGAPVLIKASTSYSQLMDLAGRCARELGKNARVNADNLKMGYTKGVHGLCPQGTQATLYALTGIKELGLITGNADWFSFKSPTIPAGGDGKGDFSRTGYYNNKVKISQVNGSWKGTYLTDSTQWQVGDVIAMGYIGKSYGHIQCYTGYCWQSDFKQNAIQVNSVDPNSVALWRLNEKGLEAIRKLS